MDLIIRVKELCQSVGLEYGPCKKQHREPSCCWLDGGTCPYGEPYGQFALRPEQFCRIPAGMGTGCHKLGDISHEAGEFFNIDPNEPDLENFFDIHCVSFTSQLRAAADFYDPPRKLALILAADIIEGTQYDERVLLDRDMPQ